MIDEDVIEFLKESNNIENEWDDDSLAQALYAWNYIVSQDKLNTEVILKTHKILMLHHNIQPNEKGYFRQRPVWIAGHEAKAHYAIVHLIDHWLIGANEPRNAEQIKQDHIDYEAIHPFIDGNGRTGRIFLNWQRIKNGLPVLVIKESEKFDYYKWFEKRTIDFIEKMEDSKLMRE